MSGKQIAFELPMDMRLAIMMITHNELIEYNG